MTSRRTSDNLKKSKERRYKGEPCESGCGQPATQRAIWHGPVSYGWPFGEMIERFLCASCIDSSSDARPRKVEPLPGWTKYVDAVAKQRAVDAKRTLQEAQMELGEGWGR